MTDERGAVEERGTGGSGAGKQHCGSYCTTDKHCDDSRVRSATAGWWLQRAGERFETSAEQSTNFVVGMATCLRKGKEWVGVGKIQLGRSARRELGGQLGISTTPDHFRARTDPQIIFEHLASGMVLTMNEH